MLNGNRIGFDIVVVAEGSVPKVYPKVTLASASTLSGILLRTLGGGEGLPNMVCFVASSMGHLCCNYSPLLTKSSCTKP